MYGDSVYPEISRLLVQRCAQEPGAMVVPITSVIKNKKPDLPVPLRLIRNFYIHAHAALYRMLNKNVRLANDESEFLRLLARSGLHVTGRFHGACLAVLTATPFVAINSNSWKIEALIDDLGLSRRRLISSQEVLSLDHSGDNFALSMAEESSISAALDKSRNQVERAFDQIVGGSPAYSGKASTISS